MRTQSKKFTVKLVSEKMAHHCRHSGYDILANHFDASVHTPVIERTFYSWLFRLFPPSLVKRIVIRGGVQYYWEPRFFDEICIMADWLLHRRRIYHVLWGENGYRYLGIMKRFKQNKIICTFHMPPAKFMQICRVTHHLQRLDGIIVLARYMVDFFSQFIPRERIFFVPYGVDTDFFCPAEGPQAPAEMPICLFVGQFLRDFQTLRQVILRINKESEKVRFVLVVPPERRGMFSDLRDVELIWGANDEEMLELYRRATLLLIPLEDAVANTAIVEGMACGLPMVISDVGGVRDYVNPEFGVLCARGDSSAMAKAVLDICADDSKRARMQEAARAHALQLDWRIIAERIEKVYEKVTRF